MAPGIIEDAQSALNPFPVINAVVGSGYPQCRLVRMKVGDYDGKIQNVDGNLLVDPEGLLVDSKGVYYQEHWIQDRRPIMQRSGETSSEQYLRGDAIQLSYDAWSSAPKQFKDNGCIDPSGNAAPGTLQPYFCSAQARSNVQVVTLGDGTRVNAYAIPSSSYVQTLEAFENFTLKAKPTAGVSVAVAAISVACLFAFHFINRKIR
jgi:hypothetical protein